MVLSALTTARRRTALLAVAAVSAIVAGCASQPPAPPTVSPVVSAPVQLAWQQGRTPEQASSTLAPLAGRLTVTPPDQIPLNRLKVPQGFKLELWAHGMPGGRAMARPPGSPWAHSSSLKPWGTWSRFSGI